MNAHAIEPAGERVEWETLHDQIIAVKSNISFKELSAAVSENVVVLNTHMQIVFVTRSCLNLFGVDDPALIYGCRIGEAMRCKNSEPNGCGTSNHCEYCGAANAIHASLCGESASSTYNIAQSHTNGRIHLQVHTEPITLKGERYTLLSLSGNKA